MAFVLSLSIDDKRVSDLLTAHAGRSSDWLHAAAGDIEQGFNVKFDRESEPEGAGNGLKFVGREEIIRGLQLMALEAPLSFAQWLTEDDDDNTFDCAWQFIVFGKLVYA